MSIKKKNHITNKEFSPSLDYLHTAQSNGCAETVSKGKQTGLKERREEGLYKMQKC